MDDKATIVQQVIAQILSAVGIQKVISIDDYFAIVESATGDAVTLFELARSKRDVEYSELIPRDILDAPENIWTRRLKTFWDEASSDKRAAILTELRMIVGNEAGFTDAKDYSLLQEFMPEGIFQVMSPDDWEQNGRDIVTEAKNDQGVLCLFDQDLRLAGRSDNAGIFLLQQALNEQQAGGLICGLLTQTITKEAELEMARKFASEVVGLTLDRFLPLSKERLRGDPMEFADGLKMMLLNYARERLARQVRELTGRASDEALERMNGIDVYDFEHIVIRSSESEGVWEPDTLFRLFNLFEYDAFRRAILAADRRASIYGDIERMRAVRDVKTLEPQQSCPSDKVYHIRRTEVFDDPELLNAGHQPIDLGDIFEISNKKFILLAQPCDLMIRENGSRSQGVDDAILVQIRVLEAGESVPEGISSFRCEYFGDHSAQNAFVKFRNSIRVSLSVLDLIVFNDDGQCHISLPDIENARFSTFHAPWRKRFEMLQKHYQKTHIEFAKIPYQKASAYQKKALGYLLTSSAQNIDFEYGAGGIFKFDIRRVGRYRAPFSVHLLGAYFSFLSRNPQEHDFARVDDNPERMI